MRLELSGDGGVNLLRVWKSSELVEVCWSGINLSPLKSRLVMDLVSGVFQFPNSVMLSTKMRRTFSK